MKIYKWPRSLIKEVELAMCNILWIGVTTSKSLTTVKWGRVCAIKEEGGIGVTSFSELNLSCKLAW